MKTTDWLQLLAYLAALLALTPLLDGYMARVFAGLCGVALLNILGEVIFKRKRGRFRSEIQETTPFSA